MPVVEAPVSPKLGAAKQEIVLVKGGKGNSCIFCNIQLIMVCICRAWFQHCWWYW